MLKSSEEGGNNIIPNQFSARGFHSILGSRNEVDEPESKYLFPLKAQINIYMPETPAAHLCLLKFRRGNTLENEVLTKGYGTKILPNATESCLISSLSTHSSKS